MKRVTNANNVANKLFFRQLHKTGNLSVNIQEEEEEEEEGWGAG